MNLKTHNNVATFNNAQFGEIRTVEQDGKFYFCGKDIAEALGYQNTKKAIKDHCKTKGVTNCSLLTNGGMQTAKFVDEGNVYRLITHSKLPSAEIFESWVFDEVLPMLRKTGIYTVKPTDDAKARMLATREENAKIRKAQLLYKVSKDCGVPKYQQVLQSHITRLLTGQQLLPLPAARLTFSAEEIGNRLGLTACMVGRLTNAHNLKNEQFGEWVYDKAKTADKQVRTFRYYENVINELRRVAGC